MRRVAKAFGLVFVGAVSATAGLAAWYHWGRSTGPTTLPIAYTQNSGRGMNPMSCQVNASQSEALAYGRFTSGDSESGDDISLFVLGAHQKLLGSAHQNNDNTTAGVSWTLQASLLQGFGPPLACYVSIG